MKRFNKETIKYINKTKVLLEILLASDEFKTKLSPTESLVLRATLSLLYDLTKEV